jgi:hypothetical protein
VLLAAASTVAIPGIGLVVAGPLAGALVGGAAGAAAGGLVGTLVGMGIPEERAKVYEQDMKEGAIVIGVTPKNEDDAHLLRERVAQYGRPRLSLGRCPERSPRVGTARGLLACNKTARPSVTGSTGSRIGCLSGQLPLPLEVS